MAERVPEVSPDEAQKQLRHEDDIEILDVRTPAEHETERVPGSHNVPLGEVEDHVDDLTDIDDDRIVVLCRSGQRSTEAAQRLRAAGMDNVVVLEGGIQAWRDAGGEVEQGEERWSLERQVRLVAGSLVLGSVLASIMRPGLKYVAAGVGAGLVTAAVTDSCVTARLLSKLPYNQVDTHDTEQEVDKLTA